MILSNNKQNTPTSIGGEMNAYITKFTEAMKLASSCNEKLKNAEESINKILTKDGSLEDFKVEE